MLAQRGPVADLDNVAVALAHGDHCQRHAGIAGRRARRQDIRAYAVHHGLQRRLEHGQDRSGQSCLELVERQARIGADNRGKLLDSLAIGAADPREVADQAGAHRTAPAEPRLPIGSGHGVEIARHPGQRPLELVQAAGNACSHLPFEVVEQPGQASHEHSAEVGAAVVIAVSPGIALALRLGRPEHVIAIAFAHHRRLAGRGSAAAQARHCRRRPGWQAGGLRAAAGTAAARSARTTARAAGTFGRRAARTGRRSDQRCLWPRRIFGVAQRENPLFEHVLAPAVGAAERGAIRTVGLTAACDQRADVDAVRLAHDDVLAAWRERVAGTDVDPFVARRACDHQTAHHAGSPQVPVMQLVLLDDVVVEPVEVLLGQQLPGEKAWPAQAFEAAAVRARLTTWIGAVRLVARGTVRLDRAVARGGPADRAAAEQGC